LPEKIILPDPGGAAAPQPQAHTPLIGMGINVTGIRIAPANPCM